MNPMRPARPLAFACLASLTAAAGAAVPVTLTVDAGESSASVQICITPPIIGQRCDSGSSVVSGFISLELDDAVNPTQVVVTDYAFALDDGFVLTYSWGFLGSLTLTTTSTPTAAYATPGTPSAPAALAVDGSFTAGPLSTIFTGSGTASGAVLGQAVNETVNLADNGAFDAALAGVLVVAGDTASLSIDLPLAGSSTDPDTGITVDVSGSVTVAATGTIAASCPADLNGDNVADFGDVSAFVTAFSTQDLLADRNNDGVVDFGDVSQFLTDFAAGC
jgi:hypothetical protein